MSELGNNSKPGTRITFEVTFLDGIQESNIIETNKWDLSLEDSISLVRRLLVSVGYLESQVNEYIEFP
jgi:hypothetical protein